MTDLLLLTKIRVPITRPLLVPRIRLIEKLHKTYHSRLTLVCAPAGFGKTTLLSAWVSSCRHPVAWISMDDSDNDPSSFLSSLVCALDLSTSIDGQLSGLLLPLESASADFSLAQLLNRIAALSVESGQPWVLVLDDYHLITNNAVHEKVRLILDRLPPELHLVISTRLDPPLPLARLRARGQLNELRQRDLRFTNQESVEFFKHVTNQQLTAEEIVKLTDRTEGWPAGIQLASLSLGIQPEEAVAVASFSGSHPFVFDYLLEEILQRQPEEIETFLLGTCILDQLCAPLCRAVLDTGVSASQEEPAINQSAGAHNYGRDMLRRLEQLNLFLIPLDDQRTWYRYHHLFRDFLQARLEQEHPQKIPELHHRAAVWYRQNHMGAESVKHALKSQDYKVAAQWIEEDAEYTLKNSQIVTLKSWLEALPADAFDLRPILSVYHAWVLLLSGYDLEGVMAHLQHALELSPSVSGEARVLSAFIAAFQGDFNSSLASSQLALDELAPDDLFFRSIITWIIGITQAWEGDFRQGILLLDETVQMSFQSGNIMMAVTAMSNQAEMLGYLGQLAEARQRYQRALQIAVDDHGSMLPIAGMALIGQGELAREWNALQVAEQSLLRGLELTQMWGQIGALDGYISLARLRQAQGDFTAAQWSLQQAWRVARSFDITVFDDQLVQVYQAQLWIVQSDLVQCAAWAVGRWPEMSPASILVFIEQEIVNPIQVQIKLLEYLTLAWLWIEQGFPQLALDLLEKVNLAISSQGKIPLLLQGLILKAIANRLLGREKEAIETFAKALAFAEPEGYIRTFLDFGVRLHPEIRQAAARQPDSAYLQRLLLEAEQDTLMPKQPVAGSSGGVGLLPHEIISRREIQVLKLISAGLSNQEIAQTLVVAGSTVKTHINHIFRKLDVSTRVQAVARARELGLLS